MISPRILFLAGLLQAAILPLSASAAEIRAAVASNFAGTLQALADEFAQRGPHQVVIITASSGKLFAQIQQGAPLDVFFSADADKIQRLEAAGKLAPDSAFIYARGRLALWWPRSADPKLALQQLQFKRLAVANPALAPYGAGASAVLEALGLKAATAERLVIGDNISQTLQFVASGNADLGFVALAQVIAPTPPVSEGRYWLVPQSMHPPLDQVAARLAGARQPQAADAFLEFVKSPAGRAIISRDGYGTASDSVAD